MQMKIGRWDFFIHIVLVISPVSSWATSGDLCTTLLGSNADQLLNEYAYAEAAFEEKILSGALPFATERELSRSLNESKIKLIATLGEDQFHDRLHSVRESLAAPLTQDRQNQNQREDFNRENEAQHLQHWASREFLQVHTAKINSIEMSHDRTKVLTASEDGSVYLLDLYNHDHSFRASFGSAVASAKFNLDGSHFIVAPKEGPAQIYSTNKTTSPLELKPNLSTGRVTSAALSPTGRYAITATESGFVSLWDAKTGHHLRNLGTSAKVGAHQKAVLGADFSSDENLILTYGLDGFVKIWSVGDSSHTQLQEKPVFEVHRTGSTRTAFFSPDGSKFIITKFDKSATVWNTHNFSMAYDLSDSMPLIRLSTFSPNSRLVLSSSIDGVAHLHDAYDGQLIRRFESHSNQVKTAFFNRALTQALTASADGSINLWDMQEKRPIESLSLAKEAHAARQYEQDQVHFASFNDSEDRIIAQVGDRSIVIWHKVGLVGGFNK